MLTVPAAAGADEAADVGLLEGVGAGTAVLEEAFAVGAEALELAALEPPVEAHPARASPDTNSPAAVLVMVTPVFVAAGPKDGAR